MKILCAVLFTICILGSGMGEVSGAPFIIFDNPSAPETYWGGKAIPSVFNEDALGGPSWDIRRMEISFDGTVMTAKVIGSLFTFHPKGSDGDLYVSSKGWKVSGTDLHHEADIFSRDEGWDFVVSPGGIYRVNFDDVVMAAGNRVDQAYQNGYGERIGDAGWNFDGDSITFRFDTADLGLAPTFGLHFSPSCGNDIVEGEVPTSVSEPSSAFLLIGGLTGLVLHRTRKFIPSKRKQS